MDNTKEEEDLEVKNRIDYVEEFKKKKKRFGW